MPTIKANRKSPTRSARSKPPAKAPRPRRCPPEALITDPGGLLAALASASRTDGAATTNLQQAVQARHTPTLVPRVATETLAVEPPVAPPVAPPRLHDDERIAHASPGVVVIIRRRRAA